MSKHAPAPPIEVPPRLCVFTTLFGGYEQLNEQAVSAQSTIPFLCLSDDSNLRSESWQIRHMPALFGMDPIRSQRDVKLRPHVYLPDFDASVYIDNSVLLTQPPERILERYPPPSGLWLPRHSFRESVLDEFLEVARLGFDDQSRVFEQLNHYAIDSPEVLRESPYWTAILVRDHVNPAIRSMAETWAAHVHRYSRRDQLSANVAFHQARVIPQTMEIDNFASWFHTWPHSEGRDRHRGMRFNVASFAPPVARVRQLEQALADQARDYEQVLADQAAQRESLAATPVWRLAERLEEQVQRHPRAARVVWRGLRLARRTAFQLWPRLAPQDSARGEEDALPSAAADRVLAKSMIYVDPEDERGRQLVRCRGDLNPPTLRMWQGRLSAGTWTHVVDIGANYGEMLVNVDLPSDVTVVAVEPNPRVLPYLERTLREAGLEAQIVASAVAEVPGSAQLLIDRRWSGTTRLAGPRDAAPGEGLELLTVPATTLAELLEDAHSAPGMRVLVKIDVEGGEAGVLRGVMELLGDIEAFEALAEIFHLPPADLAWILDHFDVQLYDLEADRLHSVLPSDLNQLSALLADGRYYRQDVVLRPSLA